MDNLKPNILLGSSFLAEHGVTIDYGRNKATFSSCNGMETDITVYRKRNTIRRRVLVEAATVVPANSRTLIHVCYADVDEFDDYGSRRDYQFIASAKGFSNCVTDARSAKVVPYTNLSDKAIRLTRKQKVGHLTDIGEDGFIATSWERANMVQTACIIQDEQRTEEMSNKPAPTDNDEDNDVWISQEFTLTDDMMAMLQSEDCTPDDLWKKIKKKEMSENAHKPKPPTNIEEVITEEGIHICGTNEKWSAEARKAIRAHKAVFGNEVSSRCRRKT
ncbi:uncharacterized protein BCR38DRAFT_215758 [Pseudomassariella vexata]|uniref:Uncharacterized protein n=1 Tax=Pseudomassariella vexata TaxID=1141098 RepID=A0A1Y2DYU4_9PEZI|nr:uncharacterized protein BCR38DRAFT_215758 [Pseudomassariella vexata]ORY64478.1 hypothetical protein BCR38DRAFT_215758 [Pseudomassariella vexata]